MRRLEKLKFRATLDHIPRAIDCVGRSARAAGFDERAIYQIQVAVDEACANVVEHAYSGRPVGDVEIICALDDLDLIIRVRDWGRGFAPENVVEPDITAPLEERSLGGLGLFLIKKLMDEVHFTFDTERGNELVMVKRRTRAPMSEVSDRAIPRA